MDQVATDALDGARGDLFADANPAIGISQGFRVHTNTKHPIARVSDLKGLKMRVPQQDVYLETAKALGVNPTALPYGDCAVGWGWSTSSPA